MTRAIMPRTSQAAVVWDPKKRDRRFSRLGEFLIRMAVNTIRANSTATAKKSSRKPRTAVWPIRGTWKSRWKRQP